MRQVYLGGTLINDVFLGNDRIDVVTATNIAYDTDAENFFTASGITNTGLQFAVNDFVINLKNVNLWDKMIQILPFVADNTSSLETQFSYNLKNTGSYQASFPNGVSTSDLSGFQSIETVSTASRVYCDTNLNPETEFDTTNLAHASIYTTSPSPVGDAYDWGTFGGGGFDQHASYVIVGRNLSAGNSQKVTGWGGAVLGTPGLISVTNEEMSGSFVASLNNTTLSFRANGANLVSGSIGQAGRYGLGNAFLGALNVTNAPAGPALVTNRKYQCLTVGTYLTNTEADTLSSIIQQFQENIDAAMGTSRSV
jgi:hypothetical protein